MAGEKSSSLAMQDAKAEEGLSTGSMYELHSKVSTDEPSCAWRSFQMILDGINHLLILTVTIYLLYYSLDSFTTLNLHIALCTVGYVLLMSEAIAVLAGENLVTGSMSRRVKAHIHWILQLIGAAFSLAGVFIMYQKKTVHFGSYHAIVGISSVAIMIFLTAFGFPVLMAVKFRKILRPVTVKFVHNFLGISCFILGMTAQCLGYDKTWLSNVTGNLLYIEKGCICMTGMITILSLRSAIPSLYRLGAALFK